MSIHIGTSGWSYAHWRGTYYPQKLAGAKWLSRYAEQFSVAEINASFYRLPSQTTIQKWSESVPQQFLFCPKMSRYLTHMKKLRDPDEPLLRFFTLFDAMRERLGPVLLQLPPMLPFNYEVVAPFYERLSGQYADYHFVLEVRHESWLEPASVALMRAHQVGWAISQSGSAFPYAELVTSPHVYIRFHGPEQLYASPYSDAMLEAYAQKMKKWEAEGHTVWAFFNNDIGSHAPRDAAKLEALIADV